MLRMLWNCCGLYTVTALSLTCCSLVVDLLWGGFRIKLKLSHNKDTTFTANSQHIHNHIETRFYGANPIGQQHLRLQ